MSQPAATLTAAAVISVALYTPVCFEQVVSHRTRVHSLSKPLRLSATVTGAT